MRALARRVISSWLRWRRCRQMRRLLPEIAALQEQRAVARRQHRKGAAEIDKRAKAIMTAALRGDRSAA